MPDYRLDLCETLGRPGPPGRRGESGGSSTREERLKEAISLSGQLMKQYPNVPEYAAAHARYLDVLGMSLFWEGSYLDSQRNHQKAVDIQQRLVKRYPLVVAYSFWLGLMERSLGQAMSEQGQLKEVRRHSNRLPAESRRCSRTIPG